MFLKNLALWSFIFFMLGMSAFATDLKVGAKMHAFSNKWIRRFTNMFRPPSKKKSLETPANEGFIYNRKAKVQLAYANLLSFFWAYVMIGIRHEKPEIELIVMFILPWAMFLGFRLGPLKLWWEKRKQKGLETLDKIETGEISVAETTSEAARNVVASATSAVDDARTKIGEMLEGIGGGHEKKTPPPVVRPSEPSRSEVVDTAKARLKKFTGGS